MDEPPSSDTLLFVAPSHLPQRLTPLLSDLHRQRLWGIPVLDLLRGIVTGLTEMHDRNLIQQDVRSKSVYCPRLTLHVLVDQIPVVHFREASDDAAEQVQLGGRAGVGRGSRPLI